MFEQIKVRYRLVNQQLSLRSGALRPEYRDESGLSGRGVRADGLPSLGRGAFDIKKIVGDLEGEPQIVGIAAQRNSGLTGRLSENRSGLAREGDQRAGLHSLQSGDRADVQALVLGDQIDHLTADHTGRTGGGSEF